MDSFFKNFNAPPPPKRKAVYRAAGDLTLFLLMKGISFTPCSTSVGHTIRVNCLLNEQEEVFFYMNEDDCARMGEEGCTFLNSCVSAKNAPFVFMARVKTGFRTVVMPCVPELVEVYRNSGLIAMSQIPEGVKNDIDFEKLAAVGIVLPE